MKFFEVFCVRSTDFGYSKPIEVMLTANLCTQWGLTNGAPDIIVNIIPAKDPPPSLPTAIVIKLEHYTGPSFSDTEKI